MTHCEKCIHYDICKIDANLMPKGFVNFFPYNEDCTQFRLAADMAEVRHGEWGYEDKYKICSLCSATTPMYSSGTAYWNYCPNCGADMRGDNNG